MKALRLFTEHPESVGESYREHLFTAVGFALRMLAGGFACLTHAVLPFLFAQTGSDCVNELYGRMASRRDRMTADTGSAGLPRGGAKRSL